MYKSLVSEIARFFKISRKEAMSIFMEPKDMFNLCIEGLGTGEIEFGHLW